VFGAWPDAACGYLEFSAPYVQAGTEARRRGWAFRQLPAGHFHMLVDPAAVTDTLLGLVRDLGRGGDSQIVERTKSG
jgi:hypothetical protein